MEAMNWVRVGAENHMTAGQQKSENGAMRVLRIFYLTQLKLRDSFRENIGVSLEIVWTYHCLSEARPPVVTERQNTPKITFFTAVSQPFYNV